MRFHEIPLKVLNPNEKMHVAGIFGGLHLPNCPSLNHLMNWSYVERSRGDVIGFAHRFQSFALAFFRQPPRGGENVHPGWTLHGVSSQWGERHWLMYSS